MSCKKSNREVCIISASGLWFTVQFIQSMLWLLKLEEIWGVAITPGQLCNGLAFKWNS